MPSELDGLSGPYLDTARLIAARTADRRSIYQRMRSLVVSVTAMLRRRFEELRPALREAAHAVTERQDEAIRVFRAVIDHPIAAQRIRCHGNLHLGQMRHVGDDLLLIDFEGEPGRPLRERRLKRSPLQDVAMMIRSFHYAAHAAVRNENRRRDRVMPWLRHWQRRVTALFVATYVDAVQGSALLPSDIADTQRLLDAHLLERAYYGLGFELNHRSTWMRAPLLDIPALLP